LPGGVLASPKATPPAQALGLVDIACQPAACSVTVDGKFLGETPLIGQQLPLGAHAAVLVDSETHASRTRTFEVRRGVVGKVIVSF
jgi:hypothetical protein